MATDHKKDKDKKAKTEKNGWTSALAFLSAGIGVLKLLAPSRVARLVGLRDNARTRLALRAMGGRRLVTSAGGATDRGTAGWAWAHVAGGVAELAYLTSALVTKRRRNNRLPVALGGLAGVIALEFWANHRRDGRKTSDNTSTVPVRAVVTINRPLAAVYDLWRDFANLPRFMTHVRSVEVQGPLRSHWTVSMTAHDDLEWDAVITEDRPNELIAWRSVEDAAIVHGGEVRFVPAPGDRGTEVHVRMNVLPPVGELGKVVGKLIHRIPEQVVAADLKRLKQLLEMGELAKSDASVHSGRHPAQPAFRHLPGTDGSATSERGSRR